MSRSGIYKVIDGKVVKVSDEIPSLNGLFDCVFRGSYYSETLGTMIYSKEQKRQLMKEKGLCEYDPQSVGKRKSAEEKRKEASSLIAQHINDKGVERIKLKDVKGR